MRGNFSKKIKEKLPRTIRNLRRKMGSPEKVCLANFFWGEEEQWSEREMTFVKSHRERYGTCSDEIRNLFRRKNAERPGSLGCQGIPRDEKRRIC